MRIVATRGWRISSRTYVRQYQSAEPTGGTGGPGGTLVGIRAEDGVVLAADTRVTRGDTVAGKRVEKVAQVHPTAAVGSPGDRGAVQSFVRALRSATDRYELRRGYPMDLPALRRAAETALPPGLSGLLGGVDEEEPHLFVLDRSAGALAQAHAALGSGREVAIAILDRADIDEPGRGEARRLAVEAVETAADRDERTGGGVLVAEITAGGVEIGTVDHEEES